MSVFSYMSEANKCSRPDKNHPQDKILLAWLMTFIDLILFFYFYLFYFIHLSAYLLLNIGEVFAPCSYLCVHTFVFVPFPLKPPHGENWSESLTRNHRKTFPGVFSFSFLKKNPIYCSPTHNETWTTATLMETLNWTCCSSAPLRTKKNVNVLYADDKSINSISLAPEYLASRIQEECDNRVKFWKCEVGNDIWNLPLCSTNWSACNILHRCAVRRTNEWMSIWHR